MDEMAIQDKNILSWGQKSDLKICPEAETIHPKMTICPLDEQALRGEKCVAFGGPIDTKIF